MITKLAIQHFRSIGDISLDLRPLTVFVGPNGAGKSNIIDAVRFVRDALDQSLDQAINDRHGMKNIRQWSPTRPYDVSIELETETDWGKSEMAVRYGFALSSSKDAFSVKREGGDVSVKGRIEGLKFIRNLDSAEIIYPDEDPSVKKADSSELFLSSAIIFGRARIIHALTDFQAYAIYPNTLREPQKQSNEPHLSTHGDNIASIIKKLRAKRRTDALNEIISGMRQVVPDLENVTVQSLGGYIVPRFSIKPEEGKGHYFDVDQMSDGTLRVLGLLVALYQDPGPGVIALEEPELTVHPGILQMLAEMIREVSQRRQIFVTTHSPELLDYFDPEDIVAVDYENGETTAGPLDESQKEAVRERLFRLGELMTVEGLHG